MSQWCRSALCGHPLPALTDNWTYGAASRHTITPISHTRPSPRSRSYYSFPVPLRVGGWVGLNSTCARLLTVDRVWVEPATSRLRVRYSTTTPLHTKYSRSDLLYLCTLMTAIYTIIFIARQHTDARYWYSKSVCPSVCLSVRNVPVGTGIRWKRLNISS